MTKPHDDELVLSTQGTQPALVAWSDDRMVCAFRVQDSDDWRALLQAAPDMARALRDAYVVLHRPCTTAFKKQAADRIREALAKANVDLP